MPRRHALAQTPFLSKHDPPPLITRDRIELFVGTPLVSPNVREHYLTKSRRVKRQREAVALAMWCALRNPKGPGLAWTVTNPTAPKAITLTGHVSQPMDGDNLQSALKAHRDALIDAGLIVSDAESAGHSWDYAQCQDGRRGVTIAVSLKTARPGGGA